MSGDGNYGGGGSGGWDLNAFGDWETMINTLGGSGASTPGTQGSATPGGYQPPNFDVDSYARPSAPRYSQGLSQIREDFPVPPTPGVVRGERGGLEEAEEEEDEEDVDLGRHPYSMAETLAIYNAWLTVSYDPIVGNQQAKKCFWEKVLEVYHQIKPKGAFLRKYKMIRSHFDRVDRQVKQFCSIYRIEAARYQSGASAADILPSALRAYYQDTKTQFKFVQVWQAVKDEERWAGGVRSSSGSTSKRTKNTASGQYSSGGGGDTVEGIDPQEDVSQEVGGSVGDAGGSGRVRRRPIGTKAAKAARARKGRGESSQSASGPAVSQGGSDTLMAVYMTATMADTSHYSPSQFAAWWNGIVHMSGRLGLPIPPQPRPPSGGGDSPGE